ncbi:hypothetical protein SE17_17865 [Kouleothrix aurantiaca]|uniref:Uncharacterized protein n=1 Tax=Kouleothrix aurantiaca TaxID=186479 RepID=A0A0P9D974_9CHLR|nr:hypothetical protein SE17_17865 [Kouleothrix aurantiaca]
MPVTPDDIRRLYRDSEAASSAEARETAEAVKNDPDEARRMLQALYALGSEDRQIAELVDLVTRIGCMQLIAMAAHQDDEFAKRIGEVIVEGMETIARVNSRPARVPRGKVKTA